MKLICVYNNEQLLKAGLLASHANFLNNIDFIGINNCEAQFSSFGQAINSVLHQFSGDEILVIAHQDIQFYLQDSYHLINTYLKQIYLDNNVFAGVVGVGRFSKRAEESGVNPIFCAGKQINYRKIDQPVTVETIDECVMITNRNTIEKFNLFADNKIQWHLYAVDACLTLQNVGRQPFVLPLMVNHFSSGKLDMDYIQTSFYLLAKYGKRHIYTTNLHITRPNLFVACAKLKLKKVL